MVTIFFYIHSALRIKLWHGSVADKIIEMFGKIGVIMCMVFVALTIAEFSYANPVIGKMMGFFFGFWNFQHF